MNNRPMKNIYKSIFVIALALVLTSCWNKKSGPNYQYFPQTDMYESPSYETYQEHEMFPDSKTAMDPADNTIARGHEVYPYPNTFDGKKAATEHYKNPLAFTEKNVKNGGQLYDIYCAICHGFKGDGNGPLSQREKMMGIPGFDDPNRNMTEGDIYHVMYYGLNNMGSYASQTTHKERWQIVHYIQTLQDQLTGKDKREFEEDTSLNRDNFDKEINPNHVTRMASKNNQ